MISFSRRTPFRLKLSTALVGSLLAGRLSAELPGNYSIPIGNVPATNPVVTATDNGAGLPLAINATDIPPANYENLAIQLRRGNTVLNWGSFNLTDSTDGQASTLAFTSTVGPASVLNRVTSGSLSTIQGAITATPDVAVWLVNTSGITVGAGGSFNGAALVLSASDILPADFDNVLLPSKPLTGVNTAAPISLTGAGALTATGSIIVVGQAITADKVMTSTSGEIALIAARDLTLPISLGSPLAITITKGTNLGTAVNIGAALSGQSVRIVGAGEGGAIASLLNINAGGLLTATAANGVVVLATQTTAAAGVTISSAAAVDGIKIGGSLTASGAGADIIISATGALSTTGSVIATTSRDFLLTSPLASPLGEVTINAVRDAIGDSITTTAGNITVNAGRDVKGTGAGRMSLVAGGAGRNVSVTATGGQAYLGTVSADAAGAATVAGRSVDVSAATVNLTSATATNGALSLTATAGDAKVDTASATNGDVIVLATLGVAGRAIGGRANLTATGAGRNVSVTATAGTAFLGPVNAGGNVGVTANLIDATPINAGGSLSLTQTSAANDLTFPGVGAYTWGTSLTLGSGRDVITGAALASPGDVTINAVRDAIGDSITTTAGNITVNAGRDVKGTGAGRMSLVAGGAGRNVSVTATGGQAYLGTVSADAAGAATVAGRSVDVSAATVNLTSATATSGALSLTATAGDAKVDTASATNGDVIVLAALGVAGRVIGGRANLTATGAGRNVSVTATGGQAYLGTVTADAAGAATVAGRSVDVSAATVNLTSATATNGALSLTATAGDAKVDTASATNGDVIVLATLGVAGRAIGGRANLTATGAGRNVSVTATAGTAFLGPVNAGGNVGVTANLIDATPINAGGSLSLTQTSAANDLTFPGVGAYTWGTSLTLGSGRDVITGAALASPGDVTINAVRDAIGDSITTTAGNITVNAGRDVKGTGAGRMSLVAGGAGRNVSVTATGGQAYLGTVSADAAGAATVAGRSVDVSAATVNLTSATATSGALSLTATAGDAKVDTASATNGDVIVLAALGVAGRVIGGRANLTATGAGRNVSVTATGGQAYLGTVTADAAGAATVAGRSVDVSAATVNLTSATATNGALSLTATAGDAKVDTASATNGDVIVLATLGVAGRAIGGRANLTATGAGRNVSVTATAGTAFLGPVNAGGNVGVTANLIDATPINAGGSLSLTQTSAANDLTFPGVGAYTWGTSLTLGSGRDVITGAALASPGDVTINAVRDAIGDSITTTAGNITVNAGRDVKGTGAGRMSLVAGGAGRNVSVTATGGQAYLGTVSADAAGAATVAGRSVDVSAATVNLTSATATNGALSLTATAGDAKVDTASATNGDVIVLATLGVAGRAIGGRANLTATGAGRNVSVTATGGQAYLGTVSADAAGAATVAGRSVDVSAATVNLTSATATNGALSLTATAGDAKVDTASATNGDVIVLAALGVAGRAIGGRANLTATGAGRNVSVTATGGQAYLGTVTADAAGAATVAGRSVDVSAATVNLTSATATNGALSLTATAGDAKVDTASATNGDVIVLAALGVAGRAIGGRANLTATGAGRNVSVTATGGQAYLGTVSADAAGAATVAGRSVDVSAATVNLTSATATNGALSLTATAGDAKVDTASATNGDVIVLAALGVAGRAIGGRANLTATGAGRNVSVTATAGTAFLGTVTAQTDVTVKGASVNALSLTASTGNLLAQASGGTATVGTGTAKGTGKVEATGAGSVITSLTADGSAMLNAGGAATGVLVKSNLASVTVTGATINVGTADAKTALVMTASNGDLMLGTGSSGTTADLKTTGGAAGSGDITVSTSLVSGGAATVSSFSDARLASVNANTGDLTVNALSGEVTGVGTSAANLEAAGGKVAVDAGTLARLGIVKAGGDIGVTGDVISVVDANSGGVISLVADVGSITVGVGKSVGTAIVDAKGIANVTMLESMGGAATLMAGPTATIGTIKARDAITVIADSVAISTTALSSAAGFALTGRVGDVAVTDAKGVTASTVTAGRDALIGNAATTGGSLTVTATRDVSATGGGRATLSAAGTGGALSVEATAGLARLGTLAANGAMTIKGKTSIDAGATSASGDTLYETDGTATLGPVTATGKTVAITASNADIGGAISASKIVVVNKSAANALRLGTGATGTGGFELTEVEVNRLNAAEVVLDAGTGAGQSRQDVAIGALALDADTGSSRFDILALKRIDVTGAVTATGSTAARFVRFGGSINPNDRATIIRIEATATGGGGRILLGATQPVLLGATQPGTTNPDPGSANLELRGTKIGVGQAQGFLQSLGLLSGGSPLDSATVSAQFIGNANSTLYNAVIGGAPYNPVDQVLLSARTLTVRVGDYALIQNTGTTGTSAGTILGGTFAAPINGALQASGPNPPDAGGFALFGTINGLTNATAALLGPTVINITAVDRANTRVNGCLVGSSGGGCLVNVVTQPTLNVFDSSKADIFKSAADFEVPFDPVVGTNNESLFGDVGTFGLENIPLGPQPDCVEPNCPPSSEQKP